MEHGNATGRVVLWEAGSREWLLFEHPRKIIQALSLDQVMPALEEVQAQVDDRGWYAAGFVAYEAAAAFDDALATHPAGGLPLAWFGLYTEPRRSKTLPQPDGDLSHGPDGQAGAAWLPSITAGTYEQAISRIKEHIAAGETYQVNFTFRLRRRFAGSAWDLFTEMLAAQPEGYAAYIDTGRQMISCASPELFFRLDGDRVTCRPMKGTAPRGRTLAEDQAQARWLRNSVKNRAENVMIVDMLRNDLGRVAATGSVRVPQLFQVERYRTLWQMTSTVTAGVRAPFAELFAALFPSASITGAPKVSTMKIITALEDTPRGLYTGSIGYLAPGRQAQFNVAIRTVVIDTQTGQAEYGVGGGVVWDSTAQDEYVEALLKARIITEQQPAFALLETLRWTPQQGYFLLERHLRRLRDSAQYFGYALPEPGPEEYLAAVAGEFPASPQRVRLLLAADGSLSHEAFALPIQEPHPLRLGLAREPLNSNLVFLYHKTTRRELYRQARQGRPDCDEVLLYNERGELTEATIANLVVELDGLLVTPPVTCGLLPGTFRATLLEQGLIHERVILREELPHCTKLFLVNSVRGWMQAELVS